MELGNFFDTFFRCGRIENGYKIETKFLADSNESFMMFVVERIIGKYYSRTSGKFCLFAKFTNPFSKNRIIVPHQKKWNISFCSESSHKIKTILHCCFIFYSDTISMHKSWAICHWVTKGDLYFEKINARLQESMRNRPRCCNIWVSDNDVHHDASSIFLCDFLALLSDSFRVSHNC